MKKFIIFLVVFLFPVFSYGSDVQLSVVDVSGNKESCNVSLDANYEIKKAFGKIDIGGGLLYGESNGEKTANRWYAKGKNTDEIGDFLAYYLLGLEGDEMSGRELLLNLSIGVGYNILNSDSMKLGIEAGPSFMYERQVTGDDYGHYAVRASANIKWVISKRISLAGETEYLRDMEETDNFCINSKGKIIGKITDAISVSFGPEHRYVNSPVDGYQQTDTTIKTSLIWSF